MIDLIKFAPLDHKIYAAEVVAHVDDTRHAVKLSRVCAAVNDSYIKTAQAFTLLRERIKALEKPEWGDLGTADAEDYNPAFLSLGFSSDSEGQVFLQLSYESTVLALGEHIAEKSVWGKIAIRHDDRKPSDPRHAFAIECLNEFRATVEEFRAVVSANWYDLVAQKSDQSAIEFNEPEAAGGNAWREKLAEEISKKRDFGDYKITVNKVRYDED